MHLVAMSKVRPVEWSLVRCRVVDGLALVRRVETVRCGVRPLFSTLRCKLGAVRLAQLLLAL
jgi:hypothetical protein